MVEVIPDVNLSFKEYQASLQQNPSNIFYQRVASRNVSTQQCSFTVSSPNKRSYLLSNAQIEWRFQFTRVDTTTVGFIPTPAATLDYGQGGVGGDRDKVSLKPVLPVANAISSITTSINGSTNTIAQPRRFMECLSMAHVSRDEATKHYEAGYPDKMGGRINKAYPSLGWAAIEQDNTMNDQYYDFANRQLRGATASGVHNTFFDDDGGAGIITNETTILVTEPLVSPPFDCYSKVDKSTMPDWSPWKWMSKVIPNVDRLEIDIQFTKLDASLMFYFYGRGSVNTRPPALVLINTVTVPNPVQASLLLYWAEVPVSTNIPRSLDLQTYNVREFQDPAGSPVALTATNTTSSLIQLNSVPSCIITHLERDKDDVDYQPVAYTSQSNAETAVAANIRTGGSIHNWDNYGEINSITYLLGDRPNVISATFSQRELYDLTMKNCKEYPYTYEDWRGRKRPTWGVGVLPIVNADGLFTAGDEVEPPNEILTAAWSDYPCKGMVIVTGADIANKTSTGVFSSNSLQVQVNWRPHSGYAGCSTGTNTYQLYNHLIFGAEFLRIELIWLLWGLISLAINIQIQGTSLSFIYHLFIEICSILTGKTCKHGYNYKDWIILTEASKSVMIGYEERAETLRLLA